ncbi:MAG: hypothetical protein AABY07_09585 [Nanoarchaeota archaeon]
MVKHIVIIGGGFGGNKMENKKQKTEHKKEMCSCGSGNKKSECCGMGCGCSH